MRYEPSSQFRPSATTATAVAAAIALSLYASQSTVLGSPATARAIAATKSGNSTLFHVLTFAPPFS